MDDLFEGLMGVMLILVLVGVVLYLIVLAIPFILYGLAVYHGGAKFGRQLRDYQLGGRAWLVLSILAAMPVLALAGAVELAGWHPLSILLAVPVFLVLAIATLAVWVGAKQWPYVRQLDALTVQERTAVEHARGIEEAVALLSVGARSLEAEHGDAFRLRDDLVAVVDRLCETDAQVWGVRRRRWETEFDGLGEADLVKHLHDVRHLPGQASSRTNADGVGPVVRAALLRIEELRRILQQPAEALARVRRTLVTRSNDQGAARARVEKSRLERAQAEAALRAFQARRVRLG